MAERPSSYMQKRGRPRKLKYDGETVSISARVPYEAYELLKKKGRINDIIIQALIKFFGPKDPISKLLISYRGEA